MIVKCVLFLLTFQIIVVFGFFDNPLFRRIDGALGIEPGPTVLATEGGVWPKPQRQLTYPSYLIIRPNQFQFKVTNETCDILQEALKRYSVTLRKHNKVRRSQKQSIRGRGKRRYFKTDNNFDGYLDYLDIELSNPCETMPYLNMDEHYELRVNSPSLPKRGLLTSQSIWGILRGLETFSQLVHTPAGAAALVINSTSIMDFPRFAHRGMHMDTARHYMPVWLIHQMLSAMEMNKMNVFHWHIVDDQSFPYQSEVYPELSEKGAYSPAHIYTQADIEGVIQDARNRGIRVIPEFDTPGHTRSWGESHPEILTACYRGPEPDGSLGPMNPLEEKTYELVEKLFLEVNQTFKDAYLHLGGDEVDFECWASNPDINAYMVKENITASQLEDMYIKRVVDMTDSMSAKSIVWQEVFDNGVSIPDDTIVHVWKYGPFETLSRVTAQGYQALLSSCWYLDALSSGGDWRKYYDCDPHFFEGDDQQKRLVLGGEACMWAEVVDANNILPRVWPRACAAAEKLWSAADVDDANEAATRLEEHVCRMNRRKIPAQPANGPGFCPDANY